MNIPALDLCIIKTIISNFNIGMEFIRSYSADLFVSELQRFFTIVSEYVKTYRAVPTRHVLLDHNSKDPKTTAYINEIWDRIDEWVYDEKEYNYDLEKLKKRHKEYLIMNMTKDLKNQETSGSLNDPNSAVKIVEGTIQRIHLLNATQAFTQRSLQDDIEVFRSEYAAKKANPELGQGILTHYSAIDYATDGLKPAELLIVSGETGAGKSTLLNNLGIQTWMQENKLHTNPKEFTKGYNILYFSLEMPFDRCRARTLARLADVPQKKIISGLLSRDQENRVELALDFIKNYPYHFEIVDIPRGATIDQIELRYEDAKLRFEPHIVIIDYMGLMEDADLKGEVPDWLKQGYIAGKIHEFTRFHNTIGLTAVQMTTVDPRKKGKEEYDPEQNVGIHRIGRSKFIMHHANIGIQIIKRKNERKYSNFIYQFIKNRDGEDDIKGQCIKNFANASLLDAPYSEDGKDVAEAEDLRPILSSVKTATPAGSSGATPMPKPSAAVISKLISESEDELSESSENEIN